jgi:hypothetical protein
MMAQEQKGMEVLSAEVKEQAAQIQKVTAQLELNKSGPTVVCLPAVALCEGGNNP